MTWRIVAAMIVVCTGGVGAGVPLTKPATEVGRVELAAECDEVLAHLVRRPYGACIDPLHQPAEPARKEIPVSLGPDKMPATALKLYWAGRELHEERYTAAARQLARGIVAAQQGIGRIPGEVVFGPGSVTAKDPARAIPDRSATCASLALLLTLAQDKSMEDEAIHRSASRAALWLLRQQTPTGLWPMLIDPPRRGDAERGPKPAAARLVRLDETDYRDCTLALIYAGLVLDDAMLKRGATRSAEQLGRIAQSEPRALKGLWQSAYELSGVPSDRLPLQSYAIDMVACRHAMQTLLMTAIALEDRNSVVILHTAAATLRTLRYEDGRWQRFYGTRAEEFPAMRKGPAPKMDPVFRPPAGGEGEDPLASTFGLTELLELAEQVPNPPHTAGKLRAEKFPPEVLYKHLARTLAGMEDK